LFDMRLEKKNMDYKKSNMKKDMEKGRGTK
jgi:hypothetical protein